MQREELATSDSDPKDIAMAMLPQYGWDSSQFGCLDDLWYGESGWDPYAENPYSGAYGIPQALPGSKMAAAGPDWETNPATQIEWGLGYIQDRYGSPCSAEESRGSLPPTPCGQTDRSGESADRSTRSGRSAMTSEVSFSAA